METGRGAAAAATRRVGGDGVAAAPAAATRIVRGVGSWIVRRDGRAPQVQARGPRYHGPPRRHPPRALAGGHRRLRLHRRDARRRHRSRLRQALRVHRRTPGDGVEPRGLVLRGRRRGGGLRRPAPRGGRRRMQNNPPAPPPSATATPSARAGHIQRTPNRKNIPFDPLLPLKIVQASFCFAASRAAFGVVPTLSAHTLRNVAGLRRRPPRQHRHSAPSQPRRRRD